MARKSHQDSVVRFVTAKILPERATKTRQYDLLWQNVGQKEPPRLGSDLFWPRNWPERATKTRQYDLLRPNVGQKEPSRLGSTPCYGQELARKATKTRQYDLLRPNVGQKKPLRLGSTICYGQELARKSHQDSAVRFVTVKSWPERATETRQYDLLRPSMGQKEPPRLGSTICYGQELARKCHQDSAVRFVTAKRGPQRAIKTRQYDLLWPRVGQKEPPRLGSTICCGQTWARKSHQDSELSQPRVGQKEPPRLGSSICYGQTWARKSHQDSAVRFVTAKSLARKSHQDSAVRFVTAKRVPKKATKTRQYDLLRPRVGQKMPPRLGRTICYGQELARKSHQDSAVRFVTAKSWPERATETRQYDLLRPNMGQKEPPRLGSMILLRPRLGQKEPPRLVSTICYGQGLARKCHQDSAVRFVTAKSWPEKATKTRQYDLLRPNVGQKEPPKLGSTICYGKTWARKSHQDSAVICFGQEIGQKEPPRLGSTISYGQTCCPERATKTRQYALLRPRVGKKKPPRLGNTICYG